MRNRRRVHAALPEPLAGVATSARNVIDANLEDADSAIKWAIPTWSLGKQPVCYLRAASKRITFGFWHGASIDDSPGALRRRTSIRSSSRTGSARAREIELELSGG